MTRRCYSILVPEDWLLGPSKIDAGGRKFRELAWNIVWSIFRRCGEHQPSDNHDSLGDQDHANFELLMDLMGRLLEGKPLAKCVMLWSARGRNSKGILEKIFQSLWGDYYVPVKSSVFHVNKRGEKRPLGWRTLPPGGASGVRERGHPSPLVKRQLQEEE